MTIAGKGPSPSGLINVAGKSCGAPAVVLGTETIVLEYGVAACACAERCSKDGENHERELMKTSCGKPYCRFGVAFHTVFMSVIGIIGGSGLYPDRRFDPDVEWRHQWGRPSASRRTRCASAGSAMPPKWCSFCRVTAAAIPCSPSEINFRANLDALKRAGVTERDLALRRRQLPQHRPAARHLRSGRSCVSSIARLRAPKSFFGKGCVAHVSMAHPVCHRLGRAFGARRPQEAGFHP